MELCDKLFMLSLTVLWKCNANLVVYIVKIQYEALTKTATGNSVVMAWIH